MKLLLLALLCLLPSIGAKHFLLETDDITEETDGELMGPADGGYKATLSYKADDYNKVQHKHK